MTIWKVNMHWNDIKIEKVNSLRYSCVDMSMYEHMQLCEVKRKIE